MSTGHNPLVSVVTPFYNTDAYLAECIESVLAQTYREFEYILVNNQSTDRSVEIAEAYAKRDSRIRLLHTERFWTQLENYNRALTRIVPDSRYFKMVQADDAIFPRCLEEMVRVAEANPAVGVVASYRISGSWLLPGGVPFETTVMSGREVCHRCLTQSSSPFGSQTTVMIRADIVRSRQPFYVEDRLFADSDAIYEILEHNDFAFVHQVLSFSRAEELSTYGRTATYGPAILGRLIRLRSFGRKYLSPQEYDRLIREHERSYREFLAEAWLRRREPEFWEFHRRGLATIGEPLDGMWSVGDALAVVLRYALSPERAGRGLLRRLRRSSGVPGARSTSGHFDQF